MHKLLGIKKYFVLVLLLQLCSVSYAYYEEYKAKTISNEEMIEYTPKEDDYLPTYNDPDLPEFSEGGTLIDLIEERTRDFFQKRKYEKVKNEESQDEEELLPQEEKFDTVTDGK